ncbi:hypothetical protein [Streptomyces similanensis]|uniref:Uncharacterized protein n=1 Tax=Streptomyces similanensis TaxID=1274988 RepID=A0ABP9KUJ0_9ACTN
MNVTVRGSRKDGERIQVLIGTTTKTFNRYNYSDEVSLSLPAKF